MPRKKIPFFDESHELTPLENMQKCDYLKSEFFSVEKIPKHYFKTIVAQTQKMQKVLLFDQNHGLTPLENIQKCDYLKCLFGKYAKMRLS